MADEGSTGGIDPSELIQAASQLEAADEAGASLTTRFSRQVCELVNKRAAAGEKGDFAVFLKSEALYEDAGRSATAEHPLLRNGADQITNGVWLTTASLSTTFHVEVTWTDAASLFAAVKGCGFGDLPAVVIDWRLSEPVATLYPDGLSKSASYEPVILEEFPVDTQQMKTVLDRFYERTLRTPALIAEGHAVRVWQDAANGVPEYRPEERIQGRLLDHLRGVFIGHHLRAEPVLEDGRADIIMWKRALSQGNQPAIVNEWVLELKALCDKTSSGESVGPAKAAEAVLSGLEQVMAYKSNLNAANGALCCYDMRAADRGDEACFVAVKDAAANDNVPLWRWYLFRQTRTSRRARGQIMPAKGS